MAGPQTRRSLAAATAQQAAAAAPESAATEMETATVQPEDPVEEAVEKEGGQTEIRADPREANPDGAGHTEDPDAAMPDAAAAAAPRPPTHAAAAAPNIAPGPRAQRLHDLFNDSLRHTLSKISWPNMAACYPTIAANAPNLLRGVRQTMVDRLELRCRQEFDKILAVRGVVPKLNELESLVAEAATRRVVGEKQGGQPPTPPHQLPADAIVAAHIARPLIAQQSRLNARLQNSQALNERLFAEIEAQRAEITGLLDMLERAMADVDGASELLAGVVGEIAQEAKDVEVEMGSV
ncbi:hypothetical protein TD95_003821 [Thielaviopsis punctulata]|uniref:Nnf1-domain-containing protein n=1 Tax=Thielaviopsis punctulata TaxID=72032 RepID=A0A0F4ZHX4_9PEZI|nr:hypothetical protein TD95_003821 [Thielaviopsis punctulata]